MCPFAFISPVLFTSQRMGTHLSWSASCLVPGVCMRLPKYLLRERSNEGPLRPQGPTLSSQSEQTVAPGPRAKAPASEVLGGHYWPLMKGWWSEGTFSWQLYETGGTYPHFRVEETAAYRGLLKISFSVSGGLGLDPRPATRAYLLKPI